jgi:hypothetical protein
MSEIRKNRKILLALLLIKEYSLSDTLKTLSDVFTMSYQQVVYFIEKLKNLELITYNYSNQEMIITKLGLEYLSENNLSDFKITENLNDFPKIDEEFYYKYLKKERNMI